MKAYLLTVLVFSISSLAHSQIQDDLNEMADAQFQKADRRLTVIYEKLLSSLDDIGKQKLRNAERAWLAYRDAQATFEADANRGGSTSPVDYSFSQEQLTDERIKQLERALRTALNRRAK